MSEGPLPPLGRINRPPGPWDTRSVAELSQISFRTELRGFDRSEVRHILESIAADYRVLQIQNASLLRQLEDLERVLEAYRRQEGTESTTALTINQTVRRASDEARAVLMRAHAQAEETMARVTAMAREAEQPVRPIEPEQGNFQVLLASTVSEMLAILKTAEQNPGEPNAHQNLPCSVVFEAPVETPAVPAVTAEPAPVVSIGTTDRTTDTTDRITRSSQSANPVPISLVPRKVGGRTTAVAAPSESSRAEESMDSVLRKIDKAMFDIPSLNGE
jgi:DivIVA protein